MNNAIQQSYLLLQLQAKFIAKWHKEYLSFKISILATNQLAYCEAMYAAILFFIS